MDDQLIAWVSQTPLFAGMQGELVRSLCVKMNKRRVPRLSFLLRHGDLTASVYLVYSGRLVVQQARDDQVFDIRYLAVGDCVGEMALLGCAARSASVKAVEESIVLEMGLAEMDALRERAPEQFTMLYMNMAREVVRRLQQADEELMRLRSAS